jgi:hypothetical protein
MPNPHRSFAIGDEVVVARAPADIRNDTLWASQMADTVGMKGAIRRFSDDRELTAYVVLSNGESWWYRQSELEPHNPILHDLTPEASMSNATLTPSANTPPEPMQNLVFDNEVMGLPITHQGFDNSGGSGQGVRAYDNSWWYNEVNAHYAAEADYVFPGAERYYLNNERATEQSKRVVRCREWVTDYLDRITNMRIKIRRQLNMLRIESGSRLPYFRKRNMFNVEQSRSDSKFFIEANKASRTRGHITAQLISTLHNHFNGRRPVSDDMLFRTLHRIREGTANIIILHRSINVHPKVFEAVDTYHQAASKIGSDGPWLPVEWSRESFFRLTQGEYRLAHVSTEDPSQVAYYQSFDKLMRGIETRTKPGRFLTKFYPDLSAEEVRKWAERMVVQAERAAGKSTLRFVENDDPDGWEWVYENAHGFSSCMMYDHPDSRYLNPRCYGDDHPVRCYAYKGNGLRLAYLGDPVGTEGGRVYARAIVRDPDHANPEFFGPVSSRYNVKGYVRVYGDSRLTSYLDAAGYTLRVGLEHVRMVRAMMDDDCFIFPYLDATNAFDDHGDYLLVTSSGDYSGCQSDGLVARQHQYCCGRCNAEHDDEDDLHYSDYEATQYCSSCEDDFVYAVVRTGRYGTERDMVLINNAIEIDGDWYADDPVLLSDCGFVQCIDCEEWVALDDTTTTDSGLVCSNCDDELVELAEESPEGNTMGYRPDCTMYVNTETGEEAWLDDGSNADDYTTSDADGEEVPMYVTPGTWREMQDARERIEAQAAFELQGPLPRVVPADHEHHAVAA